MQDVEIGEAKHLDAEALEVRGPAARLKWRVIENTAARVMISQRETTSIFFPADRFAVWMTSIQFCTSMRFPLDRVPT